MRRHYLVLFKSIKPHVGLLIKQTVRYREGQNLVLYRGLTKKTTTSDQSDKVEEQKISDSNGLKTDSVLQKEVSKTVKDTAKIGNETSSTKSEEDSKTKDNVKISEKEPKTVTTKKSKTTETKDKASKSDVKSKTTKTKDKSSKSDAKSKTTSEKSTKKGKSEEKHLAKLGSLTQSEIVNLLSEYKLKYLEGYTCYMANCLKMRVNMKTVKNEAVYINKTTGVT